MRTGKPLAPEHTATGAQTTSASPPAIAVKTATVSALLSAADWSTAELARRSRLDHSAVARLLRAELRPGPRSIAGLLLAFSTQFPRIGFYDLFEIVDDDGTAIVPQADEGGEDVRVAS